MPHLKQACFCECRCPWWNGPGRCRLPRHLPLPDRPEAPAGSAAAAARPTPELPPPLSQRWHPAGHCVEAMMCCRGHGPGL